MSRSTILIVAAALWVPLAHADTIHQNQTINSPVVWTPAGNDHIVIGSVTVTSTGSLTIEDGCRVRFDSGASMTINGTLTAVGTAGIGISFSHRDASEYWAGLSFGSGSAGTLTYCSIAYASQYTTSAAITATGMIPSLAHCDLGYNAYGVRVINATAPTLAVANVIHDNSNCGLRFEGCSDPSLANQTITGHTAANGAISFVNSDGWLLGAGNTVTGNSWPVAMDVSSSPDAASAGRIPVAGNTNNDGIQVVSSTASGAETWPDLGPADYVLPGVTVTIGASGSLTIAAGTTIKCDPSASVSVNGSLTAVGSAGNGIVFTRRDIGDTWSGLNFNSGSTGTLEYCSISYASQYTTSAAITATGMIPPLAHCDLGYNAYGVRVINATAPTLAVANVIHDNSNCGLRFEGCSDPSLANQTITGHTAANGAISFVNSDGWLLGAGNTVTGNSWPVAVDVSSSPDAASAGRIPVAGNTNNDGIQVVSSTASGAETWPDLGPADYVLPGVTVTIGASGSLTIAAGTTVKCDPSTSISVNGSLTAVGSAGNGIVFTRRNVGDTWSGLNFNSGSTGTLEYCTVEYASQYTTSAAITATGMMPSLAHCDLGHSSYGLYVSSANAPALSVANTIHDNTVGLRFQSCANPSVANQAITSHSGSAVVFNNSDGWLLGAGNTVTGNSWPVAMDVSSSPDEASAGHIPVAGNVNNDGIQVVSSTASGAETWPDLGPADYVLPGVTVTIGASGSLTIAAGTTVKCDPSTSISVNGSLTAAGTAGNGIVFTRRDVGDTWSGLNFNNGSTGTLEYCSISYASQYTTSAAITATGMMPSLAHCDLGHSSYGLYVSSANAPALSVANTIHDNTVGLRFQSCANPSVANQAITSHSGSAVVFNNSDGWLLGAGNTVTGNSWPVAMDVSSSPDEASAGHIPVVGNVNNDGIQVVSSTASGAETWPDLGPADYVLPGVTVTIGAGGSLTIAAGTTVKCDPSTSISVNGSLTAAGTAGNGIVFTRRDVGDTWSGLNFNNGSTGTLEYCSISYASQYTTSAAITATGMMPSLAHCDLGHSSYGLYVSSANAPALSVANTIHDNTVGLRFQSCANPSVANQAITSHSGSAVVFNNSDSWLLGAGNTIAGNTWPVTMDVQSSPSAASAGHIPVAGNVNNDGIQVVSSTASGAETWPDLGPADYILPGVTVTIGAGGSLTIAAGTTVKCDPSTSISVNGSLTAVGSAGNGILFTRRNVGDTWSGLNFNSGSAGTLAHCTVEYASQYTTSSAISVANAAVDLTGCTLSLNARGMTLSSASPHLVNCSVVDNASYGLYLTGASAPTFGSALEEWNDIHDNGDGVLDRDFWNGSADIDASYVYWGTVDEAVIQTRIHHEPDSASLGLVTFSPWSDATHDVAYGGGTSVEVQAQVPTAFALVANAPNPFNPATVIRYDLPVACPVRLVVYDLAGRVVATLVDEVQPAGYKSVRWQADSAASGVYLYRLDAGDFQQTRRMLLVR